MKWLLLLVLLLCPLVSADMVWVGDVVDVVSGNVSVVVSTPPSGGGGGGGFFYGYGVNDSGVVVPVGDVRGVGWFWWLGLVLLSFVVGLLVYRRFGGKKEVVTSE